MAYAPAKLVSLSNVREASGVSWMAPAERRPQALTVLLVTDLEGFTPLLARLGDLQARPIMRAHDRALRECLRAHRGRTVVHTGDGVIAAFRSVNNALACAAHMQRRFAAPTDPQGVLLRLRIGIHAGEPLAERGRLFGLCVNMAVRICKTAPAGSVWVSDLVRECAACDVGNFRSRGLFPLKGFDEPASLHELICERVLAPSRFAVRTPA